MLENNSYRHCAMDERNIQVQAWNNTTGMMVAAR